MRLKHMVKLLCLFLFSVRGILAAIMRAFGCVIAPWNIGSALWDSNTWSSYSLCWLPLWLLCLGRMLFLSYCCSLCRIVRKEGWSAMLRLGAFRPEYYASCTIESLIESLKTRTRPSPKSTRKKWLACRYYWKHNLTSTKSAWHISKLDTLPSSEPRRRASRTVIYNC